MSMDDPAIATGSRAGIRAWKLWSEPPKFLVYWCATTAAAVSLTVITALTVPPSSHDLLWLGGLIVLGVGQAEAGRHIERRRRAVVAGPHINLSSVWTFAGVLLLPPALAAVLVAVLYGHLAARSWRRLRATPPHRTIGNAGNATLSCIAAYGVMTWSGISGISISGIDDAMARTPASLINLGTAIITYFAVAAVLAIPGIWSAEHTVKALVAAVMIPGRRTADHTWRELFGGLSTNALEFTTLVVGAWVALALASPLWPLATGGALVMVWVHKGVLDKQLDLLGELDHTTRLYNMKGFYKRAADELDHAHRNHGRGAILLIEIDQVGHLNKGYSRVAGDDVLAAVADTVRSAVSDCAVAVGRFTGPELFAVLLRGTTEEQAVKIAELIRTEVAWMKVPVLTVHGRTDVIKGMSVSIGVADFPGKGLQIHKILYAADIAREVARQLGGNQVRTA